MALTKLITTIYDWYNEFKLGDLSTENAELSGQYYRKHSKKSTGLLWMNIN